MRKIFYLATAFIMIVILTAGCSYGSFSVAKASENNTQTSMQMSYEKFNGSKNRVIKLDEDQKCEISVNIASESGGLDISITDAEGNSYYEGADLPTSSFTVYLDKEEKYIIRVEGDSHTGSYTISWEITKD